MEGETSLPDLGNEYQLAAKMMLDYIKSNNIPLKFALFADAFTWHVGGRPRLSTNDLTDEQRQMVTDYVWDNFYNPSAYGSMALRLKGKPVLFGGPDVMGGWWRNHGWTDNRFTLIEVASNIDYEPEYTAAYTYRDPPSSIPGPDKIVNIWPRSSGVVTYASNSPYFPFLDPNGILPEVDPLGMEGKYDEAWRQIIEHPRRSEVELIWIWYWNSYWEVCYIEPDAGIGAYAVGDLYVRKTAHYADLFRAGQPFERFEDVELASGP